MAESKSLLISLYERERLERELPLMTDVASGSSLFAERDRERFEKKATVN